MYGVQLATAWTLAWNLLELSRLHCHAYHQAKFWRLNLNIGAAFELWWICRFSVLSAIQLHTKFEFRPTHTTCYIQQELRRTQSLGKSSTWNLVVASLPRTNSPRGIFGLRICVQVTLFLSSTYILQLQFCEVDSFLMPIGDPHSLAMAAQKSEMSNCKLLG